MGRVLHSGHLTSFYDFHDFFLALVGIWVYDPWCDSNSWLTLLEFVQRSLNSKPWGCAHRVLQRQLPVASWPFLAALISQVFPSLNSLRQTHGLSSGLARILVSIAPYSESLKQRWKQAPHAQGWVFLRRPRRPAEGDSSLPSEVRRKGLEGVWRAQEPMSGVRLPRIQSWLPSRPLDSGQVTSPSVLVSPFVIRKLSLFPSEENCKARVNYCTRSCYYSAWYTVSVHPVHY